MAGTFASDISAYQRPVDDTYPFPWLIFRVCDGTFRDVNFPANLAWAKKACAAGKLVGYTIYAVYEPGADTLGTVKAMLGSPDSHVTVMIDVESWSGRIQSDHSADITALYRALAAWLGDERRVIAYGNQGDLASLYPHRPAAEHLIIASYGSTKPQVPGEIGWQYTDGQTAYPVPAGWPRGASPFGPSDVNHFDLDPAALAAELGVGEDMPTVDQIVAGVLAAEVQGHTVGPATLESALTQAVNAAQLAVAGNKALASQVTAMQADLDALSAKVAQLETAGLDPVAVAQAIVAHLDLQVVAK